MSEFFAQTIAEFKSLGAWCVIHGPEIWIVIAVLAIASILVFFGMLIAALLMANNRHRK